MRANDRKRRAALALSKRFADADDRRQPSGDRRLGLAPHERIGLAMVGAALGMAHDDKSGAGVAQHAGRDVAGVRAGDPGVAILPADRDRRVAEARARRMDQGRGRTQRQVDPARERGRKSARDRLHGVERGENAVHLPVAGDERAGPRAHETASS